MIASMTYAGRRIGRRDIVIAAVISLLGLVLMVANVQRLTDAIPPTAEEQPNIELDGLLPIGFAIPLFLLVTVPLAWRRVAPLGATGAALAGLVLNFVLIGSDPLRCGIVLPTAFLFVFASAQMEKREALVGFVFGLGLTLLDLVVEFGGLTLAVATGLTVLIWAVGRLVRSRRQMAAELTARTVELREARDARARLEVFSDRARLSRDLDELLQRRLGELARMADTDRPGDVAGATATLVDIERESRRTLEEMRAIVGMLRDDSVAPTGPPPAITHLDALLVRATGSSSARLTFEGNPRVLPPAVELSAYRIVEHLLAALEATPDVQVHICFGDEVLTLAVSGCARRRGKAAIERARERARVQHGTLKVSAHGGRADATVSLPVAAPA